MPDVRDEYEPCWGEVEAVAEEWGDWGWDFIHACKGHAEIWDGGDYIPQEEHQREAT